MGKRIFETTFWTVKVNAVALLLDEDELVFAHTSDVGILEIGINYSYYVNFELWKRWRLRMMIMMMALPSQPHFRLFLGLRPRASPQRLE